MRTLRSLFLHSCSEERNAPAGALCGLIEQCPNLTGFYVPALYGNDAYCIYVPWQRNAQDSNSCKLALMKSGCMRATRMH